MIFSFVCRVLSAACVIVAMVILLTGNDYGRAALWMTFAIYHHLLATERTQ